MDGIVPHEEDVHVRDTSPFSTCELQNGFSQFCLQDTSSLWCLCHPPRLQEEGARVEGPRGLCGCPQCFSSPWWRSLAWSRGSGGSAESPAPFSICSTYFATSVLGCIPTSSEDWGKWFSYLVHKPSGIEISSWTLNVDENE